MTDALLGMIPHYGAWLLFAVTFLSCLAVPIPSSLLMMTAGGFAGAGELDLAGVAGASLAGALLGDQVGYGIGRAVPAMDRLQQARSQQVRDLAGSAQAMLGRRGVSAVFLSRWLFSAVGPWINFVAGSGRFSWLRFSLASGLGELVWVSLYLGLGVWFSSQIEAASEMASSVLGALASGFIFVILLRMLVRKLRGELNNRA
ncbi:MAG: DedA family protein [Notoacmeibacter sp.]|nr:DedA family protein [Notoacmeibacter sp.]MCC0032940.1 DedA family protein [Brucellaceae bacterium]